MKYKVKLFAQIKDKVGKGHWECEQEETLKATELLIKFFAQYPSLAALKNTTRLAINHSFCSEDQELNPEDELALIPPVSGG